VTRENSAGPTQLDAELEALREEFQSRGLAARVGFGERPALVVVDMTLGFTDPTSPLGTTATSAVDAIRGLLESARAADIPIVFTTCVHDPASPDSNAWCRKIPAHRRLERGSRWVQIDPRLEMRPSETIVEKRFASAFFGTDLGQRLKELGVDTIIVAGMTTSGCVRATVVDGCSLGFRVIVVEEAVADRARLPHLASLFDIDAKYADVVPAAAVRAAVAASAPLAAAAPELPEGRR
jgi:maleamate amidohydrolase